MIRDRTRDLNFFRSRFSGNRYRKNERSVGSDLPPIWFDQYYRQKNLLAGIHIKNREISNLNRQYAMNPTVYIMKIMQRQIQANSKAINQADTSLVKFKHIRLQSNSSQGRIKDSIVKFLQGQIAQQIKSLFQNKQQMQIVTNQVNSVNNTLNASLNSNNRSYSSTNKVTNRLTGFNYQNNPKVHGFDGSGDRQQVMKEVNYKIQNLNTIMRRMNVTVQQQGQLINRIDQNLAQGQDNLTSANHQLTKRVNRQQGQDNDTGQLTMWSFSQFNCNGRINQVIFILYLINIALIVIFALKNII